MISLKLPVCTHLGEGSVKVVPEIIRRENAKKVVVCSARRASDRA